MYAKVIVDITHEKLDKIFEYHIPAELEERLHAGVEVVVPFGKGNREIKGYVIGLSEHCEYDPNKVKSILSLAEKSVAIEGRLVALAAWMKEYYGGTMIQSLKTVLPIKREENKKIRRYVRLLLDEEEGKTKLEEYLKKNQKARARLLAALLDEEILEYELITKKLNVTRTVIRALEEQNVARIESEQVWRNPIKNRKKEWKEVVYTEEQQHAIDTFREDYLKGIRKTYLIYGVTGSGKTEVYMEMIASVIKEGKQAIVLIPEIALTYQTVMRFYKRFGERISIMNSKMSSGERYDQMMRAKEGAIDVMIGPRSALFTPFANLGLIVIDEEHESTYKSEQIPRYHARETAVERAHLEGASVVLGSATPSLEAFYRAQKGEYELLRLQNRAKMQEMPTVYTIDLREELKSGNRSIISGKLHELMADRLRKRQQIMLFINRRGFAGFISCRSCGYVVKCPHCDVSLASHRGGKLVCHYCGYEIRKPQACPVCGSPYIGGFKAGTQQIEKVVRETFVGVRTLRMDFDTTRTKGSYEKILASFARHEADVLIGTQMIVKGHDFPDVTLVGVVAADLSLNAEDYRCAERTFQLLCQAAGRGGRGEKPGEAVIQTYHPDHYSIQAAAVQNYEAFYEEEMSYRTLMDYPPAAHMMAVLGSSPSDEILVQAMHYLKLYIQRIYKENDLHVIGPAYAAVGKVKDIYRQVIYLKHEDYQVLVRIKDQLEKYIEINSGFRNIYIQFDFS